MLPPAKQGPSAGVPPTVDLLLAAARAIAARGDGDAVASLRPDTPVAGRPGVAATLRDGTTESVVVGAAELCLAASAVRSTAVVVTALEWLAAEVACDFDALDALLADDAAMFGARGRAAVMALKRENLSRAPSYRIESVAAVDVRGGSVAAVFECLIPGREGRGVDVVRVADGKVVAVDALRF